MFGWKRFIGRCNEIAGRGLKAIYKTVPDYKTYMQYVVCFSLFWQFGCGIYNTFNIHNVLGLKEKPETNNMFKYLSDQYRKIYF